MNAVVGLILAGGLSSRMGRPKSLVELGGRPLVAHVLARLEPQCAAMLVSDNDGATAGLHRWPILADETPARLGPLAGVEAGLKALDGNPQTEWLLSAPVDAPFLPSDLAERLLAGCAERDVPVAIASSGGQVHPTVALWHRRLLGDLTRSLHHEDQRRVRSFAERHGAVVVPWPVTPHDPFFNINTPEELVIADEWMAKGVASPTV